MLKAKEIVSQFLSDKMFLNLTETINTVLQQTELEAFNRGYKRGFTDGETKQAILEVQGRERFINDLKGKLCKKCSKVT